VKPSSSFPTFGFKGFQQQQAQQPQLQQQPQQQYDPYDQQAAMPGVFNPYNSNMDNYANDPYAEPQSQKWRK
jgi:hypothetical protein